MARAVSCKTMAADAIADDDVATGTHVLDERRLEERVDPGEVRQLAPGERRDSPVGDRVGARQPELSSPRATSSGYRLGQRVLSLALLLPADRREQFRA